MKDNRIVIMASADENKQIRLAARLRHQSVAEYVKRALNASLRHQGIDAVLFREREPKQAGMVKRMHEEECPARVYFDVPGESTPPIDYCTCGADTWNARVDAVLNARACR